MPGPVESILYIFSFNPAGLVWFFSPFTKPSVPCFARLEAQLSSCTAAIQPIGAPAGEMREMLGSVFLVLSTLQAAPPALAVPLCSTAPLPQFWFWAGPSSLSPFSFRDANGFLLLLLSGCFNNPCLFPHPCSHLCE